MGNKITSDVTKNTGQHHKPSRRRGNEHTLHDVRKHIKGLTVALGLSASMAPITKLLGASKSLTPRDSTYCQIPQSFEMTFDHETISVKNALHNFEPLNKADSIAYDLFQLTDRVLNLDSYPMDYRSEYTNKLLKEVYQDGSISLQEVEQAIQKYHKKAKEKYRDYLFAHEEKSVARIIAACQIGEYATALHHLSVYLATHLDIFGDDKSEYAQKIRAFRDTLVGMTDENIEQLLPDALEEFETILSSFEFRQWCENYGVPIALFGGMFVLAFGIWKLLTFGDKTYVNIADREPGFPLESDDVD